MNSSTVSIKPHKQPYRIEMYHITGGFTYYPIDVLCTVSRTDTNTHSVPISAIQYLKKVMLHPDNTKRTVYFQPDYEKLTQIDNTTWKMSMTIREPPYYVTSILPKFESYPEPYKQRIRASSITTWKENAFESIEYNACDILIRRV